MHGENPDFNTVDYGSHTQEQSKSLLPVSCGYFLNIVRQLMSKQRKPTLRYILLEAKGSLFDNLANNVSHHSLSDLLIELMQVNFPMFIVKSDDPENEEYRGEEESDATMASAKREMRQDLTEDQKLMLSRLQEKKEQVLSRLIKNLSHYNSSNVEDSLNSMSVLSELIEIERSFELFF